MSYFQEVHVADAQTGIKAWVSPLHALVSTETERLIGPMFGSTLDTNFYTVYALGGTAGPGASSASLTAANQVTLYTGSPGGVGNTGLAYVTTVRKARFMFAFPNLYRSVLKFIPEEQSDTYRWGAMRLTSPTDITFEGFYFEMGISGYLRIGYKDSAQDTYLDELNGDVKNYHVDISTPHAFEIVYLVTGADFFVDGTYLGRVVPDPFYPFGSLDFNATVTAYSNGVGDGSGGYIEVHANSILRLGKSHSLATWRYITNAAATGILKRGSGTLHKLTNNDNTGSIILYDDVSAVAANIICSVDLTRVTGTLTFDATLQRGLYYELTGAGKVTVSYE